MSQRSWVLLGYRKARVRPKANGLPRLVLATVSGLFFAATAIAGAQQPKELRVAAASDLQPVLPVLAADYEKETGVKLAISFGSSGNLATQIINGAPMDLFLGADFVFPEKIVAAGLADSSAPTQYAKGTLVLWARKDSPLQPISLDTLVDKRVLTVAIANDLHAPYGRAAVMALQRMKMYETVKPRLVVAENIAQAAQFVESGNAQLGLISLTAASSPHFKEAGTYVLVPKQSYAPIMQCAVVMAKSDQKAAAHAFLNWLLSPAIQARLPQMGLTSVK